MNGYLLDTNVALIALAEPAKLPRKIRDALRKGSSILSVVSYWEVVVKSMKGTLSVGDPTLWWRDALDQLAATPLALRAEHITEICSLPPIHRDPFDRVLIGQAMAEDLILVTNDGEIPRYVSARMRVLN